MPKRTPKHEELTGGRADLRRLQVELEREAGGRWIAAVTSLPGVFAYGTTPIDALVKAEALARRHGEAAV